MGQCLSVIISKAQALISSTLAELLSSNNANDGEQGGAPDAHDQGIGKPVPAYPHIIQHAYVSKMPDGDTIVCSYRHPDGSTASVRVRIMAIDCPELAQNFGNEAKQIGQSLLLHKTVALHPKDVDRYGRLVADVVTQSGIHYAEYMLKKGAAWHYKQYDKRPELAQLEVEARNNRVGLWAFARPQAPWDYRRRRRNQMSKKKAENNNKQTQRRSIEPSTSRSSRQLDMSEVDDVEFVQ